MLTDLLAHCRISSGLDDLRCHTAQHTAGHRGQATMLVLEEADIRANGSEGCQAGVGSSPAQLPTLIFAVPY